MNKGEDNIKFKSKRYKTIKVSTLRGERGFTKDRGKKIIFSINKDI